MKTADRLGGSRQKNALSIRAFAKVNLSLDVLGVLPNGYHQVKMVMHGVELHDTVTLQWEENASQKKESAFSIAITSNKGDIPTDERNLAWKAAQLMRTTYCPEKKGHLSIDLEKRIPQGAGLAGGSSNGAAVMAGLAKLWHLSVPLEELCRLGGTVGADVVFSMMCIAAMEPELEYTKDKMASTCALAEGTGVEMTPICAHSSPVVISKPGFPVPTAEVYKGIDQCRVLEHPDVDAQVEGLRLHDQKKIEENMINVLENYSLNRYDEIVYTKNMMKNRCPSAAVLMSGSGPSVFALVAEASQAQSLYKTMALIHRETFITKLI